MIIKTFKRYEKKYQVSVDQFRNMLPNLLDHMALDTYGLDNQSYTIYNLYFDTIHHDVIKHSLSKPYYKEKLRIRSYELPQNSSDPVFLELKKKIGGIVSKRRASLSLEEAETFIKTRVPPKYTNYMNQLVLDEISSFLGKSILIPSAYISYERFAFVDKKDPQFRITFDYNIKSRNHHLSLSEGDYGDPLLTKDQFLMEVKILGAIPLWLSHIFSGLNVYSHHFSKYGTAYQQQLRPQEIPLWH